MIFCGMFPFDVESFLGYLSEMPQHCSMSNLETSFVYVLFISKCELHHVLLSSSSLGDCVPSGCLISFFHIRPLLHETIDFVALGVTVDHHPPWPIASLTFLQSHTDVGRVVELPYLLAKNGRDRAEFSPVCFRKLEQKPDNIPNEFRLVRLVTEK